MHSMKSDSKSKWLQVGFKIAVYDKLDGIYIINLTQLKYGTLKINIINKTFWFNKGYIQIYSDPIEQDIDIYLVFDCRCVWIVIAVPIVAKNIDTRYITSGQAP